MSAVYVLFFFTNDFRPVGGLEPVTYLFKQVHLFKSDPVYSLSDSEESGRTERDQRVTGNGNISELLSVA